VDAIFNDAISNVTPMLTEVKGESKKKGTPQLIALKNNESVAFGAAVHGSHFDPFLSLLTCESPKDDTTPVSEKHSEVLSEEDDYIIVDSIEKVDSSKHGLVQKETGLPSRKSTKTH
jgi:hypothetical protein